ncbi:MULTISPECIES: hypothetical protein [unclassified Oceanispirochaeta]|uniref:hypothetical protein n=1 Tax=unclassified Oceanispirochaeta TaxID=2635722 RepID=UPI0011C0228B|nr:MULTISPECIES: hypothetical protein [unclassified Oceanispirochaeta]MBF9015671.1 hypothetical protein [Oceanispirochaeta sp. M2]NPD73445.1 hypothetical protein [Oceanispirochaeta sp. M1]
MARQRMCLLILITFFTTLSAWSADPVFSIRYYNKKIYYPDSPIQVKVLLSNPGSESLSFRIAENRTYNFLFTLKTMKNEFLPASREYLVNFDRNEPAFYRMITLEPGEEFGFILELDDFVIADDPGVYVLDGMFFPELKNRDQGSGIQSNQLSLTVRPGMYEGEYKDMIDLETGSILASSNMAPDEVVEYTLKARQKNQWNKFFLYLDLKEILLQSNMTRRQFEKMSQEEQTASVEAYRLDLELNRVPENQGIVDIPVEYEILQTSYTSNEAKVIVREVFQNTGFREIKKYTYYLNRFENIWKIYRYEVKNIGTE